MNENTSSSCCFESSEVRNRAAVVVWTAKHPSPTGSTTLTITLSFLTFDWHSNRDRDAGGVLSEHAQTSAANTTAHCSNFCSSAYFGSPHLWKYAYCLIFICLSFLGVERTRPTEPDHLGENEDKGRFRWSWFRSWQRSLLYSTSTPKTPKYNLNRWLAHKVHHCIEQQFNPKDFY